MNVRALLTAGVVLAAQLLALAHASFASHDRSTSGELVESSAHAPHRRHEVATLCELGVVAPGEGGVCVVANALRPCLARFAEVEERRARGCRIDVSTLERGEHSPLSSLSRAPKASPPGA